MLFLLVRAVLKARGLIIPNVYRAPGGSARPGVYGTESSTVKVDQVSPTDRVVHDSRPGPERVGDPRGGLCLGAIHHGT